jgi:hypothetical protein
MTTNQNPATQLLASFHQMDDQFRSFVILCFTFLVLVLFIGYLIYISRLDSSEVSYMNTLYPSLDGNIRAIQSGDPDCSGNVYDYYIKTAYNACSGGSYKNDYVDINILKAILKQGVRGLDFELYSVENQPVVATSTQDSYFVKETFNSVNFGTVMDTIANYAFASGTVPNPTDPLFIHLRCQSNNQEMYTNLANVFKSYDNLMLGKEYSYENSGLNIGSTPLLSLQGKVVLIIDRSNTAFLENDALLEYVNLTSGSVFMRGYSYYDIVNNQDTQELTEFNRRSMTIVFPDGGASPVNPSGYLCRSYGCQMVAMRYQYVDQNLEENALFFDTCGYAFCLKPQALRYVPVTIPDPTPQNPAYSYATRNVASDYYNFNM